MTALSINHAIAAPLQVIAPELGLKAQNLTTAAGVLTITDAATFDAGNRILMEMHTTAKAIEAQRVALKRPLADLGKQIEAVVASVAEPLDAAKRLLQGRVATYQRAEQERVAKAQREAEEKARQEREAAEKERARLQAIADEEHRQAVAAAKAKAEADAKELEAILGKPVEAKPVEVAPAPKVEIAAPAAPAPVIPAAPVASAIQVRKVQRVEFDDRMAVPVHVGGVILRPIDEAAVKRALLAGAVVPGARLVEVEQLAMGRA